MNIRFFEYTNEIDFRTFNLNSFPKRKSFINDLIDFRYFNKCHNGEFIKNNILAFNDENEIIAQSLYHPAKYYFESKLNLLPSLLFFPGSRSSWEAKLLERRALFFVEGE